MRLIDADALIELWKGCTFNGDITPIIANAPTIESERKTGKWKIREDMYGDTEATCSECGFETVVDQPGNNLPMLSDLHFCPSCGAKMEGEEDD